MKITVGVSLESKSVTFWTRANAQKKPQNSNKESHNLKYQNLERRTLDRVKCRLYLNSLGCPISHCQWTRVQTRGRRKQEQFHSLIYATKNNKKCQGQCCSSPRDCWLFMLEFRSRYMQQSGFKPWPGSLQCCVFKQASLHTRIKHDTSELSMTMIWQDA